MDKRLIDVIAYIIVLMESAQRFHEKKEPFDILDMNSIQLIYNRFVPIIHNPQISLIEYHDEVLCLMHEDGWTWGETLDVKKKTSPEVQPYDMLTENQRDEIAYRIGIIANITDFYHEFRADIENDIMDSLMTLGGHKILPRGLKRTM